MVPRKKISCLLPFALLSLIPMAACNGSDNAEQGNKDIDLASIPVPPPDGPRLASIDQSTPIFVRPALDSAKIGLMKAGASVARSEKPVTSVGCPGGWYAIRPRGFVCNGQKATTNLGHPTLVVMKTMPARDANLPFMYRSTTKETPLYEWDRAKGNVVREVGKLRRRSRFAVVGSWSAQLPKGGNANLAMMSDGRFVNAEHLEESTGSEFKGTAIDEETPLPIAFVVRKGIRAWQLEGKSAKKDEKLESKTIVALTGRFRTVGNLKFWATSDGRYVRHRDVTTVRRRNVMPDFVSAKTPWIDISVVTGTAVLYEGKKPVYATLCSVGHDRLGDPETGPTTQMGTFHITAKHLTTSTPGKKPFAENLDTFDVPWAQMMSSGQMIHGALWHSRFGIEHGPGNIQFSPADAAYIFRWVAPSVPEGWHAVLAFPEGESKTIVHIRK
ncbi:MAG: hypothetical protein CSA75_03855 [Sorangium cellulosum]|nr:MAG: hypothetical protein CSA75_03855 [Sorangium cellulosum]